MPIPSEPAEREPWLDDPLVREAFEIVIEMCRSALRREYRLKDERILAAGVTEKTYGEGD